MVEGTSDFIYLTILSSLCGVDNKTVLDENWRVLPAGGATNIPTFVSLIGPHLEITVLADSDTKGMQRVTNMANSGLLKTSRLVLASVATQSQHADLEDLFSEGDYLKLYNKTFGGSVKISDLPQGDRIVKRIEAHIGNKYDHGKVAETLLRGWGETAFTNTFLVNFEKLFLALNATMGQ